MNRTLSSSLLVALPLLSLPACSSDEPKKQAAAITPDAGVVALPDAGAQPRTLPDAGPPAVVDAGVGADAGSQTASPGAATATSSSTDARAVSSVFDRVLAKPKDAGMSHDELKHKIEAATSLRIKSLKKSARTWVLIELAPAAPARSAADQARAIDALRSTGLFSAIEGDRIMKVK